MLAAELGRTHGPGAADAARRRTGSRPPVGSIRPSTQRPIVVLPEPDSPTSASVSPRSRLKQTPLTACTTALGTDDRKVLEQLLDLEKAS